MIVVQDGSGGWGWGLRAARSAASGAPAHSRHRRDHTGKPAGDPRHPLPCRRPPAVRRAGGQATSHISPRSEPGREASRRSVSAPVTAQPAVGERSSSQLSPVTLEPRPSGRAARSAASSGGRKVGANHSVTAGGRSSGPSLLSPAQVDRREGRRIPSPAPDPSVGARDRWGPYFTTMVGLLVASPQSDV